MRLKLFSAALLAAASLLTGAALAQEKTVKLSFYPPAVHPMVGALEAWGKSLTEAGGGSLKVEIYTSEQLGKATDQYDMARDGIADITMAPPGLTPGRFPIITLSEIPFTFDEVGKGSGNFHRWYQKYAETEMGDTKLCMVILHDPGILHTAGKGVKTPADMAGLKIRPANGTMANYLGGMGASSVQAAMAEIRELVERGVVDGITFPWNSVFLTKAESKLTHHLDVGMYTAPNAFVMNKSFYEGLSDVEKKAVDSHCTPEWSAKLATPWSDFERAGREKFAAMEGHTLHKLTPEEMDAWKKAAEPQAARIFESLKRFNLDGPTLLEELKAELAK